MFIKVIRGGREVGDAVGENISPVRWYNLVCNSSASGLQLELTKKKLGRSDAAVTMVDHLTT